MMTTGTVIYISCGKEKRKRVSTYTSPFPREDGWNWQNTLGIALLILGPIGVVISMFI